MYKFAIYVIHIINRKKPHPISGKKYSEKFSKLMFIFLSLESLILQSSRLLKSTKEISAFMALKVECAQQHFSGLKFRPPKSSDRLHDPTNWKERADTRQNMRTLWGHSVIVFSLIIYSVWLLFHSDHIVMTCLNKHSYFSAWIMTLGDTLIWQGKNGKTAQSLHVHIRWVKCWEKWILTYMIDWNSVISVQNW